jgi:hypothetical protein
LKRAAGHRSVEDQRRDDATLPEPGNEGRSPPVAVGYRGDQALADRPAAVAPGHVGGGAGLVDEDKPRRVHEALPDAPQPALAGDVGTVLLGRS